MAAGKNKPGEINGRPQLTREGYDRLQERVLDIRDRQLPEMRPLLIETERDERIVAEFERLIEEAGIIDALLAQADVISINADDVANGISLGMRAQVTLEDGSKEWVRPVHPDEGFLDEERISVTSPLALALLGASAGDTVMVQAPTGDWPCKVLAISLDGVLADA